MNQSQPGTLLGVWAHPDDETYLSAGLMLDARRDGHRVAVVTATAGEAGTADPDRWPPARLARRRRLELAGALATLGVTEHRWLGYADGACADIPLALGAAAVAAAIEAVQPDTIVTFGPDGMTGHADHQAVSAWTTAAWEATGRRARLWYATVTPEFHDRWGAANEALGVWDGEPPCTPAADLAAELRLDDRALDRKLAALRSHHSQTAGIETELGTDAFRRWWATESFRPATSVASKAA